MLSHAGTGNRTAGKSDDTMSRLLPTRTDETPERSGDPAVLYVDDERAEQLFGALSAETTRDVFCVLNDAPCTASEVAERLGLSLQNAGYHLDKLREAELIEVVDVCYSEKGREMDVYAVAADPTVLVLGTEENRPRVRQAIERLVAGVGAPAALIAVWKSASDTVRELFGQ